jgi:predicted transposase YbfD/YdcC
VFTRRILLDFARFTEDETMSDAKSTQLTLRDCFRDFPDPRREHLRLHALWDIIGLTLCAIICGCDNVTEIHEYGVKKYDFLTTFLDFENGVPSHDTIGRVFALLDPVKFGACFAAWTQSLADALARRVIAIDGKTLRRAHEKGQKPLHLVSAFATENRLVLSQRGVDSKSNEITAIPELLKLLDVKKAIITIDAMGCQKEIAAQIKDQGGDYVLALKENQPALYENVQELFRQGLETEFAGMKYQEWETEEKGHGRWENRSYYLIRPTKEWLDRFPEWTGLKTVGMVISQRRVGDAEPTSEVRFFISSLPLQVKVFARAVRGHWAIENNLHWVLDVSFREDENRSRKDHTAENLAWLRRLTVSLLAQDEEKVGVACKRKMAGWDDEYLLQVAGQAIT